MSGRKWIVMTAVALFITVDMFKIVDTSQEHSCPCLWEAVFVFNVDNREGEVIHPSAHVTCRW